MNIEDLIKNGFSGEVRDNPSYRMMYATDASIYREWPEAVVYPTCVEDIQLLVAFATQHRSSIIPRGGGTSLAGQCVGSGVVMDVTKHMNRVLEINNEKGYVIVEPGVVRDELNRQLIDTDWIFGPNTSTSNRATLGGMVGNNSSGTTSIAYGVTRDKIMELEVILADGSLVLLKPTTLEDWSKEYSSVIGTNIRDFLDEFYKDENIKQEINSKYPDPSIHRRNTGYALDLLNLEDEVFDLNKLICGSEGTLCIISKIKLKLDKKPPQHGVVLVSHFTSIDSALRQVPPILDNDGIYALELMDNTILNCARQSAAQKDNLFFIEGDPAALLMIEIRSSNEEELHQRIDRIKELGRQNEGLVTERIVEAADIHRVWSLRAAGLGVLSNIPGDDMALACIEDTAVHPDRLADYISTFASMMKSHNQKAVYYAHAGAGELHLRPVLNLKTQQGRSDFRSICQSSAELVKKYNGSLSGEHGDGRVRSPFIKSFYGEHIYNYFIRLKRSFDPNNIFNPGKIVDPEEILKNIRFKETDENMAFSGYYNFNPDESIYHHAERCNGSGDCRKSHKLSPGMCPTYQASENEIHTTRARANLIREALSNAGHNKYPLAEEQLHESLSSCLSCKACKTECPSGVDIALMKGEYLSQRRRAGSQSLRDYILAHPVLMYQMCKFLPFATAYINSSGFKWLFNRLGFAPERRFPIPVKRSLTNLLKKDYLNNSTDNNSKKIILAVDEFVNYFDIASGLATYEILSLFGYEVTLLAYNSGRALISKGYLKKAKKIAFQNIEKFEKALKQADVIVGIEPSAILSFRDEYSRFKSNNDNNALQSIIPSIFLFEEFLLKELEDGHINLANYHFRENVHVLQHVHCHQRALSDSTALSRLFNAIPGWICEQINTGCCGMAGGYGYEKEHYDLSQAVGNLGLFPAIEERPDHYVVASGMSCRHQIRDGVQRKARHPAELMLKLMANGRSDSV